LESSIEDLVRSAQGSNSRGSDSRGSDSRAFAELIGRYERTALAIAYSAIGQGDRAADAVQEAFVRAWQKIGTLKEPARFGSWLAGIVRNVAIDERRRLRRQPTEELAMEAADCRRDPATEADRRETSDQVAAALRNLDEISRSAVVLRYYEGLSSKEIAGLLAISPAAVDMRLMRARQELRELLAAENMPAGAARLG
jgi:RNA polymerase sigma-70 factor (ECF subfamily)